MLKLFGDSGIDWFILFRFKESYFNFTYFMSVIVIFIVGRGKILLNFWKEMNLLMD